MHFWGGYLTLLIGYFLYPEINNFVYFAQSIRFDLGETCDLYKAFYNQGMSMIHYCDTERRHSSKQCQMACING